MYRAGYDFRHFLSGSVATVLVEVIVRGAWIVRRLNEGKPLADAMPLTAHAGAAAINAGKIAFMGPLALNLSQWIALTRYAVPQTLGILSGGSARRREQAIKQALDDELESLSARIHADWQAAETSPRFRV
jgi:hypothetical protein